MIILISFKRAMKTFWEHNEENTPSIKRWNQWMNDSQANKNQTNRKIDI